MHVLSKTHIVVGDLVYIYGNRNKSRARDRYFEVSVDGVWCSIRTFVGPQLRNTYYRVKQSECYTIPCDCPNTTAYPRRSFHIESANDCDGFTEQDHNVGFTEPPLVPVQPSNPAHHLDERPVTPANDTNPTPHCHQDADYPGVVPDVPRRSLRQVKKPKWLADYKTVYLPEEENISGC